MLHVASVGLRDISKDVLWPKKMLILMMMG